MNKLLRILACTCLLTAAAAAQATTYEFSYTLENGVLVNGEFDGTANGNLVTGLSNFSLFVNGVGFANNGNLYTYDISFTQGAGVMSFNGLATNIAVTDYDIFTGARSMLLLGAFNGVGSDAINYITPMGNGGEGSGAGQYSVARWHLAAAVPEPESYAMLLGGLALMGAVARRRQRAPRA